MHPSQTSACLRGAADTALTYTAGVSKCGHVLRGPQSSPGNLLLSWPATSPTSATCLLCSNPARAREAQVCGALEAQLWATLPSFCSWAQDTAEAFK